MSGGKRTLVVEVPMDDLRIAILEGVLGLTKPKNQTAAEAWADMERQSPEIAAGCARAADRAMMVIAAAASKGSAVQ